MKTDDPQQKFRGNVFTKTKIFIHAELPVYYIQCNTTPSDSREIDFMFFLLL